MSEHKITVQGGSSVRLPTAGKYCDRDILINATGGGGTDTSDATATEDDITLGKTAYLATGKGTGKFTLKNEMSEQDTLIEEIKEALKGKTTVETPASTPTQAKTIEIVKNGTVEVNPDDGYVLSKVTANVNVPIPDGYIQPSGSLEITQNGEYDISDKASVVVAIESSGGGSVAPDPRDDYQRVEYIESAVEETYPYIITDFYADNASGMEVIASFPKLQDRIPMGSRENSDATRFYCVYPMSSSSVYYGFNNGSSVSCALKTNTIYRLQTNFLNSRLVNVYEENGTRKANVSLSATLTTQSVPVSIFGYHSASSGSVSSKREYKLYGARCSKGHEVVREYIPCYRKIDGVVGLYEKFTGQFLTSETDDVFASGADIDWEV